MRLDIRSTRQAKGLSQVQLAEAIGVGQPTISMWESGEMQPSVRNAVKLARALGVSVEDLFADEDVQA